MKYFKSCNIKPALIVSELISKPFIPGPDNHDSFFIEGQSNSGPNDDNFAEDDDFNGPPQGGYYGGPRGPPGMSGPRGPMGPMGMGPRGPMRPYGGGPPMGHRGPPPFGMQRGPPHGGYGGPRPPGPPGGQRYPGPPRGMGGPGPRGPMQGGYGGDYGGPRQMRPHYQQDSGNDPGMDSMDGPQRGGWDMVRLLKISFLSHILNGIY